MKFGIVGATGRVGELLVKILKEEGEEIGAVIFEGEQRIQFQPETLITNDSEALLKEVEVVIDFSAPVATQQLLEGILKVPRPAVIGTTGLDSHQKNLLLEAAQVAPILYSTNMSVGIAILNRLVKLVAEKLPEFDVEIVEQHHRWKVDAPSGTALTLAEKVAEGRGWKLEEVIVTGRGGAVGPRKSEEIGVFAVRGGDVVGRHRVGFYGVGEFLELSHTATSRETFARGAIRGARWLVNQKPGLYSIDDSLGL
ncbi:MAG: 4-hydroxy-tetrahydrodipicolinate reductase [Campylobacterales bacterium]